MSENTFKIPVIPLRGLTILPGTTVHFDISRKSSIAACKCCYDAGTAIVCYSTERPGGINTGF